MLTFDAPERGPADARPPQPVRAEALLRRMAVEGWPAATEAGALVIDAWCRAGDLRRAEVLAAGLEAGGRPVSPVVAGSASGDVLRVGAGGSHPLAGWLPLPGEGAYMALRDGWQRAGLHTVAEREGPFGSPVPGGAGSGPAVFGVPATRRVAPSVLASWARRRAGYMPVHSGCMHTQGGGVLSAGGSPSPASSTSDFDIWDLGAAETLVPWRARC